MFSASALIALFIHYGYLIILPVAILEGPLVSVVGGFLVSQGFLNPFLVFLILLFGDVFGDIVYYALGKHGGRRLAHRWGKYIGVPEERLAEIEKHFHRHDWKIIIFSKTQALGAAILFTAGMVRMDFKRFITLNTLASIPKIILFEAIGYYFGESITQSSGTFLNYTGIGSLIVALVLIGLYFLIRSGIRKKEKDYTA